MNIQRTVSLFFSYVVANPGRSDGNKGKCVQTKQGDGNHGVYFGIEEAF